MNLPRLATRTSASVAIRTSRDRSVVRSALRPARAKNIGANRAATIARIWLPIALLRIWGFADQDARDEGAEHRLDADRLSEQRQGPHDEKREGERHQLAEERVVDHPDRARDQSPAESQSDGEEQHEAADRPGDPADVDSALPDDPEDRGDDDPAERILDDRRGDQDLAEVAPFEVHVAHDAGDDLDRGDRQGHAEKERGRQPMLLVRDKRRGQHHSEPETAEEGNGDAAERDAQDRPADPLDQRTVGFHPGQEKQKQDAEFGERLKRGLLRRIGRKDRLLDMRRDRPEQGRPQKDARNQLAEHRRLAKPLGRLAEKTGDDENDDDRNEKVGLERHC